MYEILTVVYVHARFVAIGSVTANGAAVAKRFYINLTVIITTTTTTTTMTTTTTTAMMVRYINRHTWEATRM